MGLEMSNILIRAKRMVPSDRKQSDCSDKIEYSEPILDKKIRLNIVSLPETKRSDPILRVYPRQKDLI